MRKPYAYDTQWFFERRDRHGVWHTVANHDLLKAQKDLKHGGVESLNLQWQFVCDTIQAYNAWAGLLDGSAQRWPSDASIPAQTWRAHTLAWIAEIPTLPVPEDEPPIPIPRYSYGAVGPGDGLARSWTKDGPLERFAARVAAAQSDLACAPILTNHGWARLNGHSLLHASYTAQYLLPVSVRHARLVFATKF